GRPGRVDREALRDAVRPDHTILPHPGPPGDVAPSHQVVHEIRQADPAHGRRRRSQMVAGTTRSDEGPAQAAGDGDTLEAAAPLGFLRMTPPVVPTSRTYLRIGAAVYPVYGDDFRGWSPRPDDFG